MIIKQKDIFFHEINYSDINNSTVILDIDGTLTCSSRKVIDENVLVVIRELQKNNLVYIFSNNYNGVRSREIAKSINLPYIESPYKKPNKKVLQYIDDDVRNLVAIGDKYLTDGLFAQLIKAEYVRVKIYHCEDDSMADKFACYLDDVMYFFAKLVKFVK